MHIHFGMSGQFKTSSAGTLEATPNTRLELINDKHNIQAHLSAMTVKHGGVDFFDTKKKVLGEDPLRADADKELVWEAFKRSRKSVGLLLMDQNVIAGLGNIYRAEVLFKAGVHPEQPGNSIDRDTFDTIWMHSKDLLHRGFLSGSILTVDPEEKLPHPWTRRYIYNQASCGRCGSKIKTWDMGNRTCYACLTCQVWRGAEDKDRSAITLKGAKEHVPFVSHCAPEPHMKRATLQSMRDELRRRGLKVSGSREDLEARLEAAKAGGMASALDAALEKVKAGEKRNVEHVALVEDESNLASLQTLKVVELKARCKELGLAVGGKKEDLIARLSQTQQPQRQKKQQRKPPSPADGTVKGAFRVGKRRRT